MVFVVRLVHVNGPPGIGKSTLARRYVDEHVGVLNLDIDLLRGLIGGWRERFAEVGEIVRPLALGMAAEHLRGGRDVVLPQYLARSAEIERFEAVAQENGAEFVEVMLLDTRQRSVERFARRGGDGDPVWHAQVKEIVRREGGEDFLAGAYDQLTEIIRHRPAITVLTSEEGAVERTFGELVSLLRS
ncbi:AAA family ATPase [Saccharopolyspora mangrovi]|uniref:AAA family ATPase n=1 Tax=Saccharopolyspora mangrovi TaxID=3082379 RepID=A0ABU6A8A8_9PSEU|nr:AAA family ATPase [Saccharopolyspora sp. S2-29]MEB3367738.1 AAA family ATPase [Saccharopolyspora sp. S2-29]